MNHPVTRAKRKQINVTELPDKKNKRKQKRKLN